VPGPTMTPPDPTNKNTPNAGGATIQKSPDTTHGPGLFFFARFGFPRHTGKAARVPRESSVVTSEFASTIDAEGQKRHAAEKSHRSECVADQDPPGSL